MQKKLSFSYKRYRNVDFFGEPSQLRVKSSLRSHEDSLFLIYLDIELKICSEIRMSLNFPSLRLFPEIVFFFCALCLSVCLPREGRLAKLLRDAGESRIEDCEAAYQRWVDRLQTKIGNQVAGTDEEMSEALRGLMDALDQQVCCMQGDLIFHEPMAADQFVMCRTYLFITAA